jgi:hypothetical protein
MELTLLQKNYLIVPLSMIVYIIAINIIDTIGNKKEERGTYIKTAVIVGIITSVIVYVHKLIPPIEEIIMSPPPF